jgi:hypothetical protein
MGEVSPVEESMFSTRSRLISATSAALMVTGLAGTANAAPVTVAAPSLVTPAPQLTEVKYRKRHPVRHARRHHRHGGNAVAAAALGLFGAALAGAIISSQYDDGYYYYGPGYYPGYYAYPRYRQRFVSRPHFGGYRAIGPRFGGGFGGGIHRGGFGGGGFRGGAFHGGGFHGGGFHGGRGHR